MANGIPKAAPKRPISPGHSRPSSKDSTVPETAPTAKSTPAPWDHRRASTWACSSPRRRPRQLAISIMVVKATPKGTRMMWKPSVKAIICRAGSSCSGSAARTSTAWARTSMRPSSPLTSVPLGSRVPLNWLGLQRLVYQRSEPPRQGCADATPPSEWLVHQFLGHQFYDGVVTSNETTPPVGLESGDMLALDRQVCFALAVAARNVVAVY